MPGYTENPFASTHSLDVNPFDDPAAAQQSANATRLEEIRQRELDLERRERELAQKSEHIRKHGRNNWPPCEYRASSSARSVPARPRSTPPPPDTCSLPPHIPLDSGGDPGGVPAPHHTPLPAVARPCRHPGGEHGRLHLHIGLGSIQRRERPWLKHCVRRLLAPRPLAVLTEAFAQLFDLYYPIVILAMVPVRPCMRYMVSPR